MISIFFSLFLFPAKFVRVKNENVKVGKQISKGFSKCASSLKCKNSELKAQSKSEFKKKQNGVSQTKADLKVESKRLVKGIQKQEAEPNPEDNASLLDTKTKKSEVDLDIDNVECLSSTFESIKK